MGIKTNSFKISEVGIMKLMQDTLIKLFYKTSFNQTEFLSTEISRKRNLTGTKLKAALCLVLLY